jgi:two-component system KDP operon response regulator KdpE
VDGISCISTARNQGPDLIVLDVGLPAGDGFVALERLRALLPLSGVPIIVVSAGDAKAYRPRALAAGASDYVEKANGKDAILAAVLGALGPATQPLS